MTRRTRGAIILREVERQPAADLVGPDAYCSTPCHG